MDGRSLPLSQGGGHVRGLLFFYRRNYSSEISALQILYKNFSECFCESKMLISELWLLT
jgi:hypothetical protein